MTAFITRPLPPDSEFRLLLARQGWQVAGCSLVELSALPLSAVPPADWIFFSSGNAVRFFFQQLEKEGLARPVVRWAALGGATAKKLAEYVDTVNFTGTGDPSETAAAFAGVAAGNTVLFPGARHSQQSVQRALAGTIRGIHLEAYDNRPVSNPPPRTERALVFTSPLNAEAYFSRHARRDDQQVIAIGATTAAALHSLGVAPVTTALAATEAALARAVLETAGQSNP